MGFWIFCATALAASLDFAIGAFLALIVFRDPSLWQLIVGGLLALLPDFDILWLYAAWRSMKTVPYHHRLISHRPFFVVPLTIVGAYGLGGAAWGWLAGLCVVWHYLHDSKPLGDGIAWLWPLIRKPIAIWPPLRTHEWPVETHDKSAHNRCLIEQFLLVWNREVSVAIGIFSDVGGYVAATNAGLSFGWSIVVILTVALLMYAGMRFLYRWHQRTNSPA